MVVHYTNKMLMVSLYIILHVKYITVVFITTYNFMLLLSLLTLPLIGVFIISADLDNFPFQHKSIDNKKKIALFISIFNFILCLFVFIFFDFSYNQFQFVLEPHNISEYPFYLGLDGISIYFVLLTTFIMP